jgi:hypothetical protein
MQVGLADLTSRLSIKFSLSMSRVWKLGFWLYFAALALVNLLILIEANQDALSLGLGHQPYDFYVLLRGASQIFTSPAQVYIWVGPQDVGAYWLTWLRDGANYPYSPMFAMMLSPLAGVYPPTAKLVYESLSYVVLVMSCAIAVKAMPWAAAKLAIPIMVFAMPVPPLFTNQNLPVDWGFPIVPGMLISPPYFADYYHGNTNTMIVALALLCLTFAAKGGQPISLANWKVPAYALGSLFLALDTFKITAAFLILPFWLVLTRKHLVRSLVIFGASYAILNGLFFLEPVLISGYVSKLVVEESIPTDQSPLWQLYHYVWYYTIPLFGALLVYSNLRRPRMTTGTTGVTSHAVERMQVRPGESGPGPDP